MGYTHYWSVKSPTNFTAWTSALKDCRKIIKRATEDMELANGAGEQGTKPVLVNGVEFNGVESDSHETFSLPKVPVVGSYFCKTNQKPYDTVVVACLARVAEVKGIRVSSDSGGEWTDGLRLATQALGRPVHCPKLRD